MGAAFPINQAQAATEQLEIPREMTRLAGLAEELASAQGALAARLAPVSVSEPANGSTEAKLARATATQLGDSIAVVSRSLEQTLEGLRTSLRTLSL